MLALILGGDKTAAEYLLISLISRVYKKEGSFLIGNLALNLTSVSKLKAQIIQNFLMNLCPLLSIFDSSIESLSESEWQPKKNYDTNKLNTSVLGEMPVLSNLLIDETAMNEGKIDKNGVENIKAIATLIEEQTISYNFQYYQQDLPTNVSVVILGNGRSMFKNAINMPTVGQSFDSESVQ